MSKQILIPFAAQFLEVAPVVSEVSMGTRTATTTYNKDKDGDQD